MQSNCLLWLYLEYFKSFLKFGWPLNALLTKVFFWLPAYLMCKYSDLQMNKVYVQKITPANLELNNLFVNRMHASWPSLQTLTTFHFFRIEGKAITYVNQESKHPLIYTVAYSWARESLRHPGHRSFIWALFGVLSLVGRRP